MDQQESRMPKMLAIGLTIASFALYILLSFMPENVSFLLGLFGYSSYLLPVLGIAIAVSQWKETQRSSRAAGIGLIGLSVIVVISAIYGYGDFKFASGVALNSGGVIGAFLAMLISLGLGSMAAFFVSALVASLGVALLVNKDYFSFLSVRYDTDEQRNIIQMLSDYNSERRRPTHSWSQVEVPDYSREQEADVSRTEAATVTAQEEFTFEFDEKELFQDHIPVEQPILDDSDGALHFDEDVEVEKDRIVVSNKLYTKNKKPAPAGAQKVEFRNMEEELPVPEDSLEEKIIQRTNEVEAEEDTRFEHTTNAAGSPQKQLPDGSTLQKSPTANQSPQKQTATAERSSQKPAATARSQQNQTPQKQRKVAGYELPPTQLLGLPVKRAGSSEVPVEVTIEKLQRAFENFNVDARVVAHEVGPTITMFEVLLGAGVKIAKLQSLSDDIALSLAVSTVRIAPVEGKTTVGVEVPNASPTAVFMREVIESAPFRAQKSKLGVAFGNDISGHPVVGDLGSMPHLLIAGATGSGKSVCINTIIMSLLLNATPREVRMLMIDPKQVELANYEGVPHLVMPVVTDPKNAAMALNWAVQEMERRYTLLADAKVKDIASFNARLADENKMPYIVIIIDELADLMMVAAKQVEEAIARIAQKARAAGMHLVVATQRPSVDVITGLIKANIPSRIAFAVSSQVDSRTILDVVGAEKLLGKGDMLYGPATLPRLKRVQGAFVSTGEVDNVVAYILRQKYEVEKIEVNLDQPGGTSGGTEDGDELLDEAIRFVRETGKASSSLLQRKFSIGYNRAARLIDIMEEMGIVGAQRGSKPREVL